MTPQETADKLCNVMYNQIPAHPDGSKVEWETAYKCAAIAVEMLVIEASSKNIRKHTEGLTNKEFWEQVLTIINKK